MIESALQLRVTRWLTSQGIWYLKLHGSIFTKRGVPDLLILVPRESGYAVPLFVELKVPGQRPTALQQKRLAEVIHAGAEARVAWSVDDVKRIVEELRGCQKKSARI